MIETFFKQVIDSLGVNGLLVVGLYGLLYRPLNRMARSLGRINWELGEILEILKEKPWQK